MKQLKLRLAYFSREEQLLWLGSVSLIACSFLLFDRGNHLTLLASLIGVTSLIFCAKGNPAGQLLMVAFSLLYGYISFTFSYYGEMFTYLGMTLPMAIFAWISWVKNPYNGNKAEVKVHRLAPWEWVLLLPLTVLVTVGFYFILDHFQTANMVASTISVTTSFVAVYLTFRRSHFYALAYGANDVVLVVLWLLAAREDPTYLSMVVCFLAFLANDVYGFLNWRKMGRRQAEKRCTGVIA